jgi:toxin ParE1/3/4
MAEVVWLTEALDQLNQIAAYIRIFNPASADRITDRLTALGDSLTKFPNRGRPAKHGLRELTTVPPYVLRYEVVDQTVYIVAVVHGARQAER